MNSSRTCQVDTLLEFFEVCFHSILFLRNVYPSSIFTLKKKYNVPVHICLYPDLNNYITEVLKSVRKFLMLNQLKDISLWILDATLNPVEKFVFNNINIGLTSFPADHEFDNIKLLEDAFRKFCLKLSMADYILKPTQENSSFKIFIKTEESGYSIICEDPAFEGFPWVAEEVVPSNELKQIIPIQSVHNPTFQFESYAEI